MKASVLKFAYPALPSILYELLRLLSDKRLLPFDAVLFVLLYLLIFFCTHPQTFQTLVETLSRLVKPHASSVTAFVRRKEDLGKVNPTVSQELETFKIALNQLGVLLLPYPLGRIEFTRKLEDETVYMEGTGLNRFIIIRVLWDGNLPKVYVKVIILYFKANLPSDIEDALGIHSFLAIIIVMSETFLKSVERNVESVYLNEHLECLIASKCINPAGVSAIDVQQPLGIMRELQRNRLFYPFLAGFK